ncbi:MAG: RDD family protein [Pelomonas sp.]|nr:RDD family protein [Roseateles sp.]
MTDTANPYSAPASEVADVDVPRELVRASSGRRFGTLLVDYAAFMAFSYCTGIAIVLMFGAAGVHALTRIPNFVTGMLIMTVYYGFFEGLWARTPGKFIFGTIVVDEQGGKPSFGQVLVRSVCRFIPFETFSGFSERCWHDSIPKTRVVLARDR